MVVAAASTFYKDILPRAAALLDAGMLSDVIDVHPAEGDFIFKRVMYAGNVIATVKLDGAVKFLTVRAAAFANAPKGYESSPVVGVPAEADKLPAFIEYGGRVAKATSRPDSTEARGNLVSVHDTLADVFFSAGNYAEAAEQMRRGMFYKRILRAVLDQVAQSGLRLGVQLFAMQQQRAKIPGLIIARMFGQNCLDTIPCLVQTPLLLKPDGEADAGVHRIRLNRQRLLIAREGNGIVLQPMSNDSGVVLRFKPRRVGVRRRLVPLLGVGPILVLFRQSRLGERAFGRPAVTERGLLRRGVSIAGHGRCGHGRQQPERNWRHQPGREFDKRGRPQRHRRHGIDRRGFERRGRHDRA